MDDELVEIAAALDVERVARIRKACAVHAPANEQHAAPFMLRQLDKALAAVGERDAEIARLREVFDRTCKQHSEAMRGTCNTYQAEIARLRDVERRHLGWCDTCRVYHRVGNCDVTGEPPSKEAREGWSRPTPQAAPPGADVMKLAENLFPLSWAELWFSGPLNQLPRLQERVARTLQQYGDERVAAVKPKAGADLRDIAAHIIDEVLTGPYDDLWKNLQENIACTLQKYNAEIERLTIRLCAEPNSDVTALFPPETCWNICRVRVQQYGDERAAAAREAAIEEALWILAEESNKVDDPDDDDQVKMIPYGISHDRIAALAAKPGSKT